jgi:hypothetical protein
VAHHRASGIGRVAIGIFAIIIGNDLDALSSLCVAWVLIRVKLQGEFAISLLPFVNCCRTVAFVLESKNFVMDLLFMRARAVCVVLPAKVLKKLVLKFTESKRLLPVDRSKVTIIDLWPNTGQVGLAVY